MLTAERGDGRTDILTDGQTDQTDRLHEFHSYMELKIFVAFLFSKQEYRGILIIFRKPLGLTPITRLHRYKETKPISCFYQNEIKGHMT